MPQYFFVFDCCPLSGWKYACSFVQLPRIELCNFPPKKMNITLDLPFTLHNLDLKNVTFLVIHSLSLGPSGSPAHPLLSLALSYPEDQGGADKDSHEIASVSSAE